MFNSTQAPRRTADSDARVPDVGRRVARQQSAKPRRSKSAGMAREALVWSLVLSSMVSTPVLSAQTDISSSPITSTNAAQVKPNIMLLMDTSDSMGWGHMPDEVESQVGFGAIGYKAAQCNVLYYNRNQTYAIPKQADGTRFRRHRSRRRAMTRSTPVEHAGRPVELHSRHTTPDPAVCGNNDTPSLPTTTTRPAERFRSRLQLHALPGRGYQRTMPSSDGGTWNRVIVGAGSGVGGNDERTNFAIWYSYYRTRMLLIKSAASLAFTPLTDSFRVGLISVRPKDNPGRRSINADQVPGDQRLHDDPARPLVRQAVLAEAGWLVADPRRAGARRPPLRRHAGRHQPGHDRRSGAVLLPAELHRS